MAWRKKPKQTELWAFLSCFKRFKTLEPGIEAIGAGRNEAIESATEVMQRRKIPAGIGGAREVCFVAGR